MTTYTQELDKQINNTREHADAIRATNPQRATYEDGFADGLGRAYRMVAAQAARIAELEAALEPFAHPDLCAKRSGNANGDASPIFGRDKAVITLGDCRRARALLETK